MVSLESSQQTTPWREVAKEVHKACKKKKSLRLKKGVKLPKTILVWIDPKTLNELHKRAKKENKTAGELIAKYISEG